MSDRTLKVYASQSEGFNPFEVSGPSVAGLSPGDPETVHLKLTFGLSLLPDGGL